VDRPGHLEVEGLVDLRVWGPFIFANSILYSISLAAANSKDVGVFGVPILLFLNDPGDLH